MPPSGSREAGSEAARRPRRLESFLFSIGTFARHQDGIRREANADLKLILREAGEGGPVRLIHVPDVGASKPEDSLGAGLFCIEFVVLNDHVTPPPGDRRHDDNTLLAAADPATDPTPGVITSDAGGRGTLQSTDVLRMF